MGDKTGHFSRKKCVGWFRLMKGFTHFFYESAKPIRLLVTASVGVRPIFTLLDTSHCRTVERFSLLWRGVDLYCLSPSLSILVASIVCNT